MGRLGIIADLTFKIFPAPQVRATLRVSCRNLGEAVRTIVDLMRRPLDIEALDLEPPGTLYIRVAGDESGLATHARRVGEATNVAFDILDDPAAAEYWRKQLSFSWLPADAWLVKVPMTPRDIVAFDAALPSGVARRYSVGGNVAWAAWPARDPIPATAFEHRAGLIVRGPAAASAFVGRPTGRTFAGLVKRALDPDARFPALS